jgi:hypothetical protein
MEASPEKIELFEMQKEEFKIKVEKLAQECRPIFDNDSRVKTLMLTIDEYLLHFLQLTLTNNRSENSLEKWIGRKKRYLEFLNYRFNISDIPLAKLEFKFLEDLKSFNMVHHCCEENTATKYAQCIKEMLDRAVSNKWVSANIFSTFQCSYSETNMNWMTLQDMQYFARFNFSMQKYNETRYICCNVFFGLCICRYTCCGTRRYLYWNGQRTMDEPQSAKNWSGRSFTHPSYCKPERALKLYFFPGSYFVLYPGFVPGRKAFG